ncbi:MAG TPA: hypothetical protein VIV60_23945, partial [Polyangiaceae bacterium]
ALAALTVSQASAHNDAPTAVEPDRERDDNVRLRQSTGASANAHPSEYAARQVAARELHGSTATDVAAANHDTSSLPASATIHKVPVENAAATSASEAALDAHPVNDTPAIDEPAKAVYGDTKVSDRGQLAEETRLIDAALTAIRNGNLTLAHRLLNDHSLRFPHAKLAKERGRAIQKLEEAERHAQP